MKRRKVMQHRPDEGKKVSLQNEHFNAKECLCLLYVQKMFCDAELSELAS